MSDVHMRQNDLRPPLDCTLYDGNGARDLTGETLRFVMRSSSNDVITDQTSTGTQVSVLNSTAGRVRYAWVAGDTDDTGDFLGEWEATNGSNEPMTFPNSGHIEIRIDPELST